MDADQRSWWDEQFPVQVKESLLCLSVCLSVLWCERVKQRLFPAPSFPLCQTHTHTLSLLT
jgi:hypothetical protein